MTRIRVVQRFLAAAALLALTGCNGTFTLPFEPQSQTPTDPPPSAGPEILVVEESNATLYRMATADSVPLIPDVVDGIVDRSIKVETKIDGHEGGRLRCGRFVLVVPKDAWVGLGDVTMSMPDSTVMLVGLDIQPSSLNKFAVPVTLCLVTEGTTARLQDLAMYWWDPAADKWMSQVTDKDLTDNPDLLYGENYTQGMAIELGHFSRYSGGKAGW
jgi:hypothetical protein